MSYKNALYELLLLKLANVILSCCLPSQQTGADKHLVLKQVYNFKSPRDEKFVFLFFLICYETSAHVLASLGQPLMVAKAAIFVYFYAFGCFCNKIK